MIQLTDVSFSYDEIPALRNVSLGVKKGDSVCLLGPNGSGKSTLLRLMNGIILPQSGVYTFEGEEITGKKLRDEMFLKRFHQKIGFIFQSTEAQLFCADVYDEIAFGPRQMGLSEEQVASRVEDCLDLFGLQDFRKRPPYHLSGGEKKKVAIASVLALNPDVLILDEPTSGLDPKTGRWLAEFLVELNGAGKTLITSTHDLELVREISDRAVLLDETHAVAADLKTAELLSDFDLLRRVNLVDKYYHRHSDGGHEHGHTHRM